MHPEDLQPVQHLEVLTRERGLSEMTIQIVNMIPNSLSGETARTASRTSRSTRRTRRPSSGRRSLPTRWAARSRRSTSRRTAASTWSLPTDRPRQRLRRDGGHHGRPSPTRAGAVRRHAQRQHDPSADPAHGGIHLGGRADDGARRPRERGPAVGRRRQRGRRRRLGDRVFIGNNDFNQPGAETATVDLSLNAATAAAPAGFAPLQLEHGAAAPRTARRSASRCIPAARSTPHSIAGRPATARTSRWTSWSPAMTPGVRRRRRSPRS